MEPVYIVTVEVEEEKGIFEKYFVVCCSSFAEAEEKVKKLDIPKFKEITGIQISNFIPVR
jgi:hypothetical protein